MRLFVGVTVDDTVLSVADEATRDLRRRLPRDMNVRWIDAANMHVTVKFIGNVQEERAADLLMALRPALPIAPFQLRLGECGVFPPHGPPRVIWIGLASGLPSLRAMHEEFDRRLAPLGFEPEHRPFSAHLTLARVGDAPRTSSKSVRQVLEGVRLRPVGCSIGCATVFQSRLSPKGAVYQALFDVPCAG